MIITVHFTKLHFLLAYFHHTVCFIRQNATITVLVHDARLGVFQLTLDPIDVFTVELNSAESLTSPPKTYAGAYGIATLSLGYRLLETYDPNTGVVQANNGNNSGKFRYTWMLLSFQAIHLWMPCLVDSERNCIGVFYSRKRNRELFATVSTIRGGHDRCSDYGNHRIGCYGGNYFVRDEEIQTDEKRFVKGYEIYTHLYCFEIQKDVRMLNGTIYVNKLFFVLNVCACTRVITILKC